MWTPLIHSFRNLRIRSKVLTIVISIFLSFSLFIVIGFQFIFNYYDREVYQQAAKVLNVSSKTIEAELSRLEKYTFSLITDPIIQSELRQIHLSASPIDRYRHRNNLVDRLYAFKEQAPYFLSLEIITPDRESMFVGDSKFALVESQEAYALTENLPKQGGVVWILPTQNESDLKAVRGILDKVDLSLVQLGTAIVRVDISRMINTVLKLNEAPVQDIFIYKDGLLIYPADAKKKHPAFTFSGNSGYELVDIEGEKSLVAYSVSGYNGWTYLNIVPLHSLTESVNLIKTIFIAIFLLAVILVFYIALLFVRGITRPLEVLTDRMKLVQTGKFQEALLDGKDVPLYRDEIGRLNRDFRVMTQRINELIEENYTKQLQIKDTEFQALQSQINPHFLYNTLESINWIAKSNKQNMISSMAVSLGHLFRKSINNFEWLVPLKEELDLVRHYLNIQQIRFQHRLIVDIEIDERDHEERVLKWSIQPLVENAIKYGLERKIEPCRITIRVTNLAKWLEISVIDDGPGIDISGWHTIDIHTLEKTGTGIGLKNIDERMKRIFGQAYEFVFFSGAQNGAHVMLRFPK